jgi:uncharacterized protein (DUF2267 family)
MTFMEGAMSATGLPVFDTTIQETNHWLNALLQKIGGNDRHRAYLILRATLHALRDRLGTHAAAHFAAQLPMLLRGMFYEGWRPSESPSKERHVEEFLGAVCVYLPPGMVVNAEQSVRAVFEVIWDMIDAGEVVKIIKSLPRDLRELWPQVPFEN